MNYVIFAFLLMISGLSAAHAQSRADSLRKIHSQRKVDSVETGIASYYHSRFQGKPTASGEIYDTTRLTAAHNSLPFGTKIRVTNIRNGKQVVVRVNDRLHHSNTRLVDLSKAAAAKLGFIRRGLTRVQVEILK